MNFTKIRTLASSVPTFIVSLIPVFKSCPPCPICMPKYAAIFAFFGFELADYSMVLEPIIITTMLISLGLMCHQSITKKITMTPTLGAVFFSALLFVMKFIEDNFWGVQGALAGLLLSYYGHYYHLSTQKNCCNDEICTKNTVSTS